MSFNCIYATSLGCFLDLISRLCGWGGISKRFVVDLFELRSSLKRWEIWGRSKKITPESIFDFHPVYFRLCFFSGASHLSGTRFLLLLVSINIASCHLASQWCCIIWCFLVWTREHTEEEEPEAAATETSWEGRVWDSATAQFREWLLPCLSGLGKT